LRQGNSDTEKNSEGNEQSQETAMQG
jgi:hypothetical protein